MYYLLSGMDENNNYNFYKKISNILKKDLKNYNTIIYIPTYPDNIEKCNKLAKSEIFENIGIHFNKSIVLDNSYSLEDIEKILKENNLIFLYGGNPYEQIKFINKNKITELIKEKTIIALSAGSINMCKKAICTKDEEFEESNIYDGMGLVDFSIEPHFNMNNSEILEDLKKISENTCIYALEDDAFIIIEKDNKYFYRKYISNKKQSNKEN